MNPLDAENLLAANEIYAKIVSIARESKDDEKLALALPAQGHSFVLSSELELAEKSFDESREISLRLGDKRRASLSSVGLCGVSVWLKTIKLTCSRDRGPKVFSQATSSEASEARSFSPLSRTYSKNTLRLLS